MGPQGPAGNSTWAVAGQSQSSLLNLVGIGTTTPQFPLHVSHNLRAAYFVSTGTTGSAFGAWGQTSSGSGIGTVGYANGTSGGGIGVQGESAGPTGRGVYGLATSASGENHGVYGVSASTLGTGVTGEATASTGMVTGVLGVVSSTTDDAAGVYGGASGTSGATIGVWGATASSSAGSTGVYGTALGNNGTTFGVYGAAVSAAGYGVFSEGKLAATGTKSFVIDHPLDPSGKLLHHYCTEGPEPLLVYRGTVELDEEGAAWVELPAYFEAINKNVTYQLTPVGAAMPSLHIAEEVRGNLFRIAGGVAGKKVSWSVTGVRNDAWVQAHGAPVETEKAAKGRFVAPTLMGGEGLWRRENARPPRPAAAAHSVDQGFISR